MLESPEFGVVAEGVEFSDGIVALNWVRSRMRPAFFSLGLEDVRQRYCVGTTMRIVFA